EVDFGAVVADRSAPAHPYAVDGDVDVVRFEHGGGSAYCGDDASPGGVLTGDRAFEDGVAGDRASDADRVGGAGRAHDFNGDGFGRAFRVGQELAAQVLADFGEQAGELCLVRGGAGSAAGHEHHGVVGGGAAVGVEPVEGHLGGGAQ